MTVNFTRSSKREPCPLCPDSDQHGDCRFSEGQNVVLCHRYIDQPSLYAEAAHYKYLHASKDQMWGVYVYQEVGADGKVKGRKQTRKQPARQPFYYPDRQGNPLIMVVRVSQPDGHKAFYQHKWDGAEWKKGVNDFAKRNVPIYRYQEVRQAISQGNPIFMAEGEGKADNLWDLGLAATTTIGGSKKYRAYGNYFEDLKDAQLVLCPDRDKVGIEHMADIARDFPEAQWCYVFPDSPLWKHLPDNGGLDIADWIADGADAATILAAVQPKRSEDVSTPTDKTNETDTPEGRQAKHQRLVSEWQRIEAIQDLSLQALERYLLSQKEKVPARELAEIGKRSRYNVPIQTISLKALCEQPDKSQGDLIEGVIEMGTSILMFAQSKAGKTPLVYDIVYSVATGTPWMQQFAAPQPGGVMIIQSDEQERASKKNFRRRGLHRLENVHYVNEPFSIDDLPRLPAKIEELKRTIDLKLITVDSLTSINLENSFSENDAEFARDLYRLVRTVSETGVTLLVTHHRKKHTAMGDLDAASGSGRIVAAVDDVWALHRMPPKEDPTKLKRVLERVAAHDGDLFRWVLELNLTDRSWDLEGEYDAEAQEGDRVSDFLPPEKINLSATEQVLAFLNQSEKRWEASDLAETANLNLNTVRRILGKLIDDGKIDRDLANYRNGNRYPYLYFCKALTETQKNSELFLVEVDRSSNPAPGNGLNCDRGYESIAVETRSQSKNGTAIAVNCDRSKGSIAVETQTESQKRTAIDAQTKSPENFPENSSALQSDTKEDVWA